MKFWSDFAAFPFKSHDAWFITENKRWGNFDAGLNTTALVNKVNRADMWRDVAKQYGIPTPATDSRGSEKFFDGKVFDPANPDAYLSSLAIKKLG